MSERVAIVAVHGVGSAAPGDTADHVSSLLLGMPEKVGARYDPLSAEEVHIPLQPLTILQPLAPGEPTWIQKILEERTSFLTRQWRTSNKYKKEGEDIAAVADDFMRLTLQDYRGAGHNPPKDARDATAYITTRLKTARRKQGTGTGKGSSENPPISSPPESPPPSGSDRLDQDINAANREKIDVHVYEMHWADLSRPKSSILSFFMAMYQLLFHLASLSRLAISTGNLENQGRQDWKWLDRMQNYAVRMLTLPIPILNILLFATLFGLVPRFITTNGIPVTDARPGTAAIAALILGLAGYAFVFSPMQNAQRRPWRWALYSLVWGIVPAGIAYVAAMSDPRHIVLSTEGLLVGASLVYFSVNSYDDVRDGAKEVAFALGAAWALIIALCWICGRADSVQQAMLWTMQILLAGLRISWTFLFAFSIAAMGLGKWACRSIKKLGNAGKYARARAAVRTSRLALAMPTLGIFIVTLAFWSAIFVKTSGNRGQVGNTIAVRLFGNSVEEIQKGPRWLHSIILPDRETVKGYLGEVAAPFTVKTKPVKKTSSVEISATDRLHTQTTTLTVNPKAINLSLNPTTVTGGDESAGAVTLNDPNRADRATVVLSSSDPNVTLAPENLTVAKGISVTPLEETPATPAPNPGAMRPNDFFQGLLVWSATPGFPVTLLFMLSGFFLLILAALPSVFTEITPPIRSSNFDSNRMGDWLSRGLDATRIVTALVWSAAFIVLTVFAVFYETRYPALWQGSKDWMQGVNHFFLSYTAIFLEYIGIVASSLSILTALVGSGSPVLGIILDVDNYLRTSAKDATLRAQVAERYVSLLRYISEYKDPGVPDDMGYDRVVIVAHSLGALISADLLRFLRVQRDTQTGRFYFGGAPPEPGRPKIQLRLFSFGNPLRQLLNRAFPYLYEWVNPEPDNSLHPLQRDPLAPAPVIQANKLPDPNDLELERWVSAYRSGDYVGRSLWLEEWYTREVPARQNPNVPEPVHIAREKPPGRREEMCIGAGAHTHYWDQSAPDIAEKLDELIKP